MRTSRAGRFFELSKLGARVTAGYAPLALKGKREAGELIAEKNEESVRLLAETLAELKGPILKLGQLATLFDAYLPPDLSEALAIVQDDVPPENPKLVRKVIREELGAPPEELFESFDEDPVAGASLGQVHRVRLKNGAEAALKVQYPGSRKALKSDFRMLGSLVRLVHTGQAALGKGADLKGAYDEVRTQVSFELDYVREKDNINLFQWIFEGRPDVAVPKVYDEYSTGRVLAMEFIEGPRLRQALPHLGEAERRRIGEALTEVFFRPLLGYGVLHADPHPGNYLVLHDGRLGLLDYGCVKRFNPAAQAAFRELYGGVLARDARRFLAGAGALGLSINEAEARRVLEETPEGKDGGNGEIAEESANLIFGGFFDLQESFFPSELVFYGRSLAGLYAHLCSLDIDIDTAGVIAGCLGSEALPAPQASSAG